MAHTPPPCEDEVEVDWGDHEGLAEIARDLRRTPSTERNRGTLAKLLLWIFAAVLVLGIVGIGIVVLSFTPDQSAMIVAGTIIPFLDTFRSFVSELFLPLLAFVLGYYFGRNRTD